MPFDLSNIGWIVTVGAVVVLALYRFQVFSSLIDFKGLRKKSIEDKTADLLEKYHEENPEED